MIRVNKLKHVGQQLGCQIGVGSVYASDAIHVAERITDLGDVLKCRPKTVECGAILELIDIAACSSRVVERLECPDDDAADSALAPVLGVPFSAPERRAQPPPAAAMNGD